MQNPAELESRTRHPRRAFRTWPDDTWNLVYKYFDKPNNELLRVLKQKKATVQVPVRELNRMAKRVTRKTGVSMRVRKFKDPTALGLAHLRDNGSIDIEIHPVSQYWDKRFVQDLMEHEMDHCRNYLKWMYRKSQKPVFEGPKWIEKKKK